MKKFRVKFIEERCHIYEVEAENKEDAENLAENEYYGWDDEELEKDRERNKNKIKFIGIDPEANELISCEVVE